MQPVVRAIVLALTLWAVGSAQTPARDSPARKSDATGTISGRVVAAGSGEVIRKARIIVNPIAPAAPAAPIGPSGSVPPRRPDTMASVETGNDGRFVVSNVPVGRVTLSAGKAGYVTTTFGARRLGTPPLPVDVRADRAIEVEIRMPKSGAISGRIVDEFGDPVELRTVVALISSGFVHAPRASRLPPARR